MLQIYVAAPAATREGGSTGATPELHCTAVWVLFQRLGRNVRVFCVPVEHNPILRFNYVLIELESDTVELKALSADSMGCTGETQRGF